MTSSTSTSKTCIVCGTDCSNKPRTKDSKGRYYCQPCYDKARQRKSDLRPAAMMEAAFEIDEEPATFSLLEQLVDSVPRVVVAAKCAHCGHSLAAGALICTLCGYNTQTHHTLHAAKIIKAPRETTGGAVWPPLVGIISIVFGASGFLINGIGMIANIMTAIGASNFKITMIALGSAGLVCSLSLWLLRDGIRIVCRNSRGVQGIRIWAITKLILVGICLALFLAITQGAPSESFARPGSGGSNFDVRALRAIVVPIFLWLAFWPAFILILFLVPRIQRDVDQWG